MSGTLPTDPQRPALDAAAPSFDRALRRAAWVIAWERLWPPLAGLSSVIGLFLAVSWAGLWQLLPVLGRAIGLGLFLVLLLAALAPFARLRWPSRSEALSRLDRGSGLRHRPATALQDTLTTNDPVARALWEAQRQRMLAALARLRAGVPSPALAKHDPMALRALVVLLLVATFIAAGDERRTRVAAAFDWQGVLTPAGVRVDAWVAPPLYTNKPPIILTAAKDGAAADPSAKLPVPAGSTLIVRASGGTLDVAVSGQITEAAPPEPAPGGASERHFAIAGDGTAQVRAPASGVQWSFVTAPDRPPSIALAKDPERVARGALQLIYKLEDDYGVTEANAELMVRQNAQPTQARPLFQPPRFALVLPNAHTRSGVGQTVKDLSEDPYAGAEVTLTLTARDEAGNEARSTPYQLRLPERLFTKPLARALIEQRRILALDAEQRELVAAALDALLIAPEVFMPDSAGQYLGLYTVNDQLGHAKNDDALREVVGSLWALAVSIEDGDITDVDKALRAAQEALKQALERGASDEEIKKLTDNLRAALDNYLRQLAEQLRNNPQQLARPLDPNSKVIRQQDLNAMVERMERLSRSGDKEAAKQLLDQLQQMLENLQMAQPGQGGDGSGEQALNELGDVIRKQQQLRDKTFQQGQEQRSDRDSGEPNLGDLQQDQQALRDRLHKLQQELAKRGMTPGANGQQGEQGQQGQGGQSGDPLGDADSAMADADGRLGEGNADRAVDSQGKALDALRRGAQRLAEAMQQGEGDGQGNGPGQRLGRQQGGNQSDPLGRPLRGRDLGDDFSVKIPGEIDVQRVRRILEELRRRLGDSQRPQRELDYLERLLKD